MRPFWIAPSILSADFARLGEEVDRVLAAGADVVHFDVMDNHYVPNLTIGPMVCKALRNYGITAPIDVHLMVKPVDRLIGDFIEAGASFITFHPEASEHIDRSLQLIRTGRTRAESCHFARLPQIRNGQAGHDFADVGKPRIWRPVIHTDDTRQVARGAQLDRRQRL
jgi:pentose-5-phosphate-3-epimerase